MEVLITSLGLNSIINKSDRTGEVAFEENGKQYIRKYPLYCVRWYNPKNKRSMKDVYIVKNNSIYFRINSIEKVEYKKTFTVLKWIIKTSRILLYLMAL